MVDWNRFDIGKGNSVAIDNGSGATLNRVTGGSPSSIFGNLTASGSMNQASQKGNPILAGFPVI
ncbi:filamentous hemagglutinin N-terminal domain-containing protein [Caballeronia sp. M23-90]